MSKIYDYELEMGQYWEDQPEDDYEYRDNDDVWNSVMDSVSGV